VSLDIYVEGMKRRERVIGNADRSFSQRLRCAGPRWRGRGPNEDVGGLASRMGALAVAETVMDRSRLPTTAPTAAIREPVLQFISRLAIRAFPHPGRPVVCCFRS
jgi:hypothetical protein